MFDISQIKKCCIHCHKYRSLSQFHKDRCSKDGFKSICKICKTQYDIQRRKGRGYRKKRRDPIRRLNNSMGVQMRRSVKNWEKGTSWSTCVEWTLDELIQHLESQFLLNMTWEKYGKWHLDHIRPVYEFDIPDVGSEGFKQCWALTNLRPLWAHQNQIKGKSSFANRFFEDVANDEQWIGGE